MFELDIDSEAGEQVTQTVTEKLEEIGIAAFCNVSKKHGKYCISLNPCSDKTAQHLCRFWHSAAPQIENWTFEPFGRPRTETIPEIIKSLGSDFALSALRFYLTVDEELEKYELSVVSQLFEKDDSPEDIAMCRLICYLLLGEAFAELYIGAVHTSATPPQIADMPELDAAQFTSTVAETPLRLPWTVSYDPTSLCFSYGSKDVEHDIQRTDIVAGLSRHPQLLAFPFSTSDELRLKGGEFCFLYYDADLSNKKSNASTLIDRARSLEQLLTEYNIGYVIGHASGNVYNYIDLMLFDEPMFHSLIPHLENIFECEFYRGYFSLGNSKIQ